MRWSNQKMFLGCFPVFYFPVFTFHLLHTYLLFHMTWYYLALFSFRWVPTACPILDGLWQIAKNKSKCLVTNSCLLFFTTSSFQNIMPSHGWFPFFCTYVVAFQPSRWQGASTLWRKWWKPFRSPLSNPKSWWTCMAMMVAQLCQRLRPGMQKTNLKQSLLMMSNQEWYQLVCVSTFWAVFPHWHTLQMQIGHCSWPQCSLWDAVPGPFRLWDVAAGWEPDLRQLQGWNFEFARFSGVCSGGECPSVYQCARSFQKLPGDHATTWPTAGLGSVCQKVASHRVDSWTVWAGHQGSQCRVQCHGQVLGGGKAGSTWETKQVSTLKLCFDIKTLKLCYDSFASCTDYIIQTYWITSRSIRWVHDQPGQQRLKPRRRRSHLQKGSSWRLFPSRRCQRCQMWLLILMGLGWFGPPFVKFPPMYLNCEPCFITCFLFASHVAYGNCIM